MCFLWYGGNILLADREGKPVLLDSMTGNEMRRIDFGKFSLTFDRHMMVWGDRFYALASGKDAIYAVCVDLVRLSTPVWQKSIRVGVAGENN